MRPFRIDREKAVSSTAVNMGRMASRSVLERFMKIPCAVALVGYWIGKERTAKARPKQEIVGTIRMAGMGPGGKTQPAEVLELHRPRT